MLKTSLFDTFPKTSMEVLEVLEQMLRLNPYLRPTAKELLKNKIFDKHRVKKNEVSTPYKIIIELDNSQPVNYEEEQQYMNDEAKRPIDKALIKEIKLDVLREMVKLRKFLELSLIHI